MIAHLPTPMIPAHSTVLTIIAGLVVEARLRGHDDVVVIDPSRSERLEPRAVIAASPFKFPWGRRRTLALAVDHVSGWATGRRPAVERLYRSALRDVDIASAQAVILHDASFAYGALRPARSTFGDQPMFLYSHIALSRSLGRRELRSMVDRLAGVITVSEFVAERLVGRLDRSEPWIAVVPNGIDLDKFSPGSAGEAGRRPPVVVAAGLTTPGKGSHHLDAALSGLRTPGWRARIAGGGWYVSTETALDTDAADPRIERVGFLPHREMPSFLRTGRVFVFPSVLDESFGLGLLEAMACGLACIASPVGGVPELGGDAVRYVDPRDHRALTAAIDELLSDDSAATELGERARKRAMGFSTNAQYERFASVVRSAG